MRWRVTLTLDALSVYHTVTVEADDWWAARQAASAVFLQRVERGVVGGALVPPSSSRLIAVPERRTR